MQCDCIVKGPKEEFVQEEELKVAVFGSGKILVPLIE